ncbi:MAG: CoA pyrophosphatase [Proteobacteria bacterium]|nr:CoA pyrophosphatase [Pseudomonadota bacterium]
MEQRDILSPGQPRVIAKDGSVEELSAEMVARRFAGAPTPRRRASLMGRAPAGAERPRGDHDLNPEFYEPGRRLTPAAVLVPIVEREAGLTVLLTRRTDHLDDHAGQVSFPGGRIEAFDQGPEAAALREAEEETGLPPDRVRLIGRLDTYVTRTGFEVIPVVGLVTPPFPIAPDSFEVAEVFEVPLAFFLAPENRQRHSRVYEGKDRQFYVFPFKDYYIWGATAGMLVNLVEVLNPDAAG